MKLRFALDHHVNLRPVGCFRVPLTARRRAGHPTSWSYARARGSVRRRRGGLRVGTPTRLPARRVSIRASASSGAVRDAFGGRQKRGQELTPSHKTNVLVNSGGLWQRTVNEVGPEFPGGQRRLLPCRRGLDVLRDLTRALRRHRDRQPFGDTSPTSAPRSPAASPRGRGNLDVSRAHPSMFEPVS